MSNRTTTGIDVGTHHVKVVVTEQVRLKNGKIIPRVIGIGMAESRGLRHGYIINPAEATQSITQAVKQAEKTANVRIEEAFISIGGISLESITASGVVAVSRGNNEVTETDLQNVAEECETRIPDTKLQNRKIIHSIPIEHKVDGQLIYGDPVGLRGMKVESKRLIVTALEHHVNDLIDAVEDAGVEVVDVMASPLAASLVSLSKKQKIAGCVLVNIGAETVSIVVYENNLPISLEVFSLGSTDITNDIALGLKIPLEDAHHIKHGESIGVSVSRKKLDEIINARLSDMFELVSVHLQKIKRDRLLPAGVIITGGGSRISSVIEQGRNVLELPSRLAAVEFTHHTHGQVQDGRFAVAYGLCIFGFSSQDENKITKRGFFKRFFRKTWGWLKQFLP